VPPSGHRRFAVLLISGSVLLRQQRGVSEQ
jgi:hypothetical protein